MSFSHQRLLMVFHRCLSDSKSLQVSRTLLRILADLSNAVVWMVFTRAINSKSSCLCTNHLMTAPSVPITIGLTVTFMFHNFFSTLARSTYSPLFLLFFQLLSMVSPNGKIHYSLSSLFFLAISWSGRLSEIRWSVCITNSPKIL